MEKSKRRSAKETAEIRKIEASLPKKWRDLIIREKPGVRTKSVAEIIDELRYGSR